MKFDLYDAAAPLTGNEHLLISQNGKVVRTDLPAIKAAVGGFELLTADRTYFVRKDGFDTNSGLADTAAGAFLTIGRAIQACYSLNMDKYKVVIQVGDGVYNESVQVMGSFNAHDTANPVSGSDAVTVTLRGNLTTPTNVQIVGMTDWNTVRVSDNGQLRIEYLQLQTSGTGSHVATAVAVNGGYLEIGNGVDFAGAKFHINAWFGGMVGVYCDHYTVSAGANCHLDAYLGGSIEYYPTTVLFTQAVNFSTAFAIAEDNGAISSSGVVFSGTVTGKKFLAVNAGRISTYGSGLDYLAGDTPGAASNTGSYDGLWGDGTIPMVAVGGLTAALANAGGGEVLAADRTYYVDGASGSDTNDGLTTGTAFKTIQAAMDFIGRHVEASGHAITVSVAPGTYAESVMVPRITSSSRPNGTLALMGSGTVPGDVVITNTVNWPALVHNLRCPEFLIGNLRLKVQADWGRALHTGDSAGTYINGDLEFESAGTGTHYGILAYQGATVSMWAWNTHIKVIGTWGQFLYANGYSRIDIEPQTLDVTGVVVTDAFAAADAYSTIELYYYTGLVGTVTGKRYALTAGSQVYTWGGGESAVPGSIKGTLEDSCSYDGLTGLAYNGKLPTNVKELLTAPRTYYVDASTGSDSNDGRSTATAFKTIQKAIDYVATNIRLPGLDEDELVDLMVRAPQSAGDKGKNWLIIQVAPGTYNESLILRPVEGGRPFLRGNPGADMINTIVRSPAGVDGYNPHAFEAYRSTWRVAYFHAHAGDMEGNGSLVYCYDNADLVLGSMHFTTGAPGANWLTLIEVAEQSMLTVNWHDWEGNTDLGLSLMTVHGTDFWKFLSAYFGSMVYIDAGSFAFPDNSTARGAFLDISASSNVQFYYANPFTGTVSGTRASLDRSSTLFTWFGGASYVPGSLPMVVSDDSSVDAQTGLQLNSKLSSLEVLTANRTYYVNAATGADSNDGKTAGTAFKTIQKAFDACRGLDTGGLAHAYRVAVQLADGTYTERAPTWLSGPKCFNVHLVGNTATPKNVQINGSVNAAGSNTWLLISGLYVDSTSMGNWASTIFAQNGATIGMEGPCVVTTGADNTQTILYASNGGNIGIWSTLTVESSACYTLLSAYASSFCYCTGTLNFPAGGLAVSSALMIGGDFSFVGLMNGANQPNYDKVTGVRFTLTDHSQLATYGAGLSGVPGTIVGTMEDTCSYDGLTGLAYNGKLATGKEVLTGPRTYYVDAAAGSDSNTGLTAGTAFKTLQAAATHLANTCDLSGLDPNNAAHIVTIQAAAGTYAENVRLDYVEGQRYFGQIVIRGNPAAVGTVVVSPASAHAFSCYGGLWQVRGFKIVLPAGYSVAFYVSGESNQSYLIADTNHIVGASSSSFVAQANQGRFDVSYASSEGNTTLTLEGTFSTILDASQRGTIDAEPASIVMVAGLSYTRFLRLDSEARATFYYGALTGTPAGKRYDLANGTYVNTYGGGASYIPGTTAGALDDTVIYDGVPGIELNNKVQAPLVSGTSIKTINGSSLLGSGDLTLSAGTVTTAAKQAANFAVSSSVAFYRVDTTAGAVTATLPAAPLDGEIHYIKKVSTDANAMTIDGNGKQIDGASTQSSTSNSRPSYTLIYSTADGYWSIV